MRSVVWKRIGVLAVGTALWGSLAVPSGALPGAGASPSNASQAAAAKPSPAAEDEEVKLGRENAAENDKQVKLITDAAILDRVNRIGQEIAAVANSVEVPALWGSSTVKKFHYTFKVVDDKDVNAYSLPGGYIYVNKGLLDYVHSDDELAGVLAHEITHVAHHHMMKLLKEQSKMQPFLPLILLAAVLSKANGQDVSTLALATNLYMVAKLNSYGVKAEEDADHGAVEYLIHTHYNPVGLLTFMERLAKDEALKPDRPLGIYRTHPPTPERAQALIAELRELKIPLTRTATDPSLAAQVSNVEVNGAQLAEVKIYKTVVARVAPWDGVSAEARARKVSEVLDRLLDQNLQMYELRLSSDKRTIYARNETLIAFTDADAAAQKVPAEKLAQNTLEALRTVIWQGALNRLPASATIPD
ncbi:MAG: M48 family metalloprotease [Chthonomonadales bacterium]